LRTLLMGFVMAPLPNVAARPATVEECQSRAQ
jgi:ribosomal protein S12 methylthiotransferase accessory factor YcaO